MPQGLAIQWFSGGRHVGAFYRRWEENDTQMYVDLGITYGIRE